jgi:aspartyl-tRNA(Asn)/glutamyl-tRNA(Gln) amidotransferase subunit A
MTRLLHEISIAEAGAALREGSLTARALAEHELDRIASIDPLLHAFILVTGDRALADADRADQEIRSGLDRGPLHGIPYGLKDIIATADIRTTCNSRLLVEHIPAEDAAVEEKLRAGGAVLLGKLSTAEFALGGPTPDLPFPAARNPWNPDHFTGGSSTGAGAAVGAGFMRFAIGSDTGGSIRSPACHCGVVGLKPTYGLVSLRGVYPLSYSLDHCGPLAWSVQDAALVMNVIAGYDPLDPASVNVPIPDYTAKIGHGIRGLRIGYARALFADVAGVSEEVIGTVDAAAAKLVQLGAEVEEVELPDFELFKACGRLIMLAEAFAVHEENLRKRPLDFGRYTFQRIAPAATLSAVDFIQALRLRRELTKVLNVDVLRRYDALITTTALSPAPGLDQFPLDWPPPGLAVSVQTAAFNVTGNPAMGVPAGFSSNGLPIGIQLIGRPFDEPTLFRIAGAFEAAAGVTARRPALRAAAGRPKQLLEAGS